jgi:hypothetical protein
MERLPTGNDGDDEMRDLTDVLDAILYAASILLLVFLFEGDPDLWDKLRERAMQETSCTKGQP